jgi:hypothetical protein
VKGIISTACDRLIPNQNSVTILVGRNLYQCRRHLTGDIIRRDREAVFILSLGWLIFLKHLLYTMASLTGRHKFSVSVGTKSLRMWDEVYTGQVLQIFDECSSYACPKLL